MTNEQQKLSASLGLAQTIERSFFKPESKVQRVMVQAIRAFGEDGKGVTLKEKAADGTVTEKPAKCYAEVDVLDPDNIRSKVWQVLSKPCVVQLAHAIDAHGSVEGLMLDVSTSGKGKEKEFHVTRVTAEQLKRELEEELAAQAAKRQAAVAKVAAVAPPTATDSAPGA